MSPWGAVPGAGPSKRADPLGWSAKSRSWNSHYPLADAPEKAFGAALTRVQQTKSSISQGSWEE